MSVSGNYSTPVWVNGYECWNCTDVDNAKKFVDPAHPKSGPFNVDARTDPTRTFGPAVSLGGGLAGSSQGAQGQGGTSGSRSGTAAQGATTGVNLDLSV